MCGRYALGIRAAFVRHQLQNHDMPVEEAPEDDEVRQSYNFAPGYHGLVYRADVPDYGAGPRHRDHQDNQDHGAESEDQGTTETVQKTKYKLQAMQWGLVPFWTKRSPDCGTVLKTINARDDSLIENRGMWNTMKQKKRCVIIAQGFYEWLKKNDGKEKIPHYMKRKDGQLMCFAGLWDCVQYDGAEEKLYTYTIITTDSNKQLKFLHDRMPVILENGSDEMRTWLDPNRYEWSRELQSLLRPFGGELECYIVSQDVGKVGNNSPNFIIPVASSANKNNIANFFSRSNDTTKCMPENTQSKGEENLHQNDIIKEEESYKTIDVPRSEDNAPVPTPNDKERPSRRVKRERDDEIDYEEKKADVNKDKDLSTKNPGKRSAKRAPLNAQKTASPSTLAAKSMTRQTRSATSNRTALKSSPKKTADGSQRITNFFGR